jgi:aspartyl aminopeptidase
MSSLNDLSTRDFEGSQPSAEGVSVKIMNQIERKTVPQYVAFLQEKLVSNSVENARQIASKHGVTSRDVGEHPFFVNDEDMGINGSTGNSFALVKPGKKEKPLRIIIAHSDVPSLRVPINPIYTAETSRGEFLTPSVSICTEPFGGIRPEDWYGMDVEIVGKVYMGGQQKQVSLDGRIKQKSLHTDHPEILRTLEGLRVDTGLLNPAAVYRALGMNGADDFARAKLYCLPKMIRNGNLVGNELGAFGHDDRCCVWTSLMAGLETMLDNDNTTLIFALDNEEIGSVGNSASYRGFFENVVRETLKVVHGDGAKDIELPAALNRRLLGGMPAIFADVGVGIGPQEMDDAYGLVDKDRASRLGWGVMINSTITTSPKHVDRFITLLGKHLPGRDKEMRYQIGGDYTPVDSRYSHTGSPQMHDSFGDVMPVLNVGAPVSGLHHPRTEVLNIFDLHWMKEAYKIYLKN